MPPHQLRDLNEIAGGVAQLGDPGAGHVRWWQGELGAARVHGDAAIRIGDRVDTGTWFVNRYDYLDPALAWTGVKDSGRGCSLSRLGYESLTRPKSFHFRLAP